MNDLVTNTGLHIPDDCSEEEFFAIGHTLAVIEKGSQWAIGDWYNAIKWGDKEAACERAGLNYKSVRFCGSVCTQFEMLARANIPIVGALRQLETRISVCDFKHHRVLAIDALTPEQRADLLAQAQQEGWSAARLTHARDRLLGKPEKVPLVGFDAKVAPVYEALPETTAKRVKAALDQAITELRNDYQKEVLNVARVKTEELRASLLEREKDVAAKQEVVSGLRAKLDGLMTEDEYKMIRGCLHPDRAPADRKEQFEKAFVIFIRLEKTVNRNFSAKDRAKRGWS